GAKPLEPFGKGSNALKAGTPDAEPVGPTARFKGACAAVRSAPGRGRAEAGVIRGSPGKAREAQAAELPHLNAVLHAPVALTSSAARYLSPILTGPVNLGDQPGANHSR